MEKEQILQLGSFQLPVSILMLIIGFVVAVFITERQAIIKGWAKEKWSDLIISISLVLIIVYKFGWIIFDFGRVLKNPSSIIWMSGSTSAIILAILLALIMLFYKVKKNKYPTTDILDLAWIFVVIGMFIYNLSIIDYGKSTDFFLGITMESDSNFSYHPINWYRAALLALLLTVRFIKFKTINFNNIAQLYILLGAGLLITSIFDLSVSLFLGFTYEQWTYIFVSLIGVGLLTKK